MLGNLKIGTASVVVGAGMIFGFSETAYAQVRTIFEDFPLSVAQGTVVSGAEQSVVTFNLGPQTFSDGELTRMTVRSPFDGNLTGERFGYRMRVGDASFTNSNDVFNGQERTFGERLTRDFSGDLTILYTFPTDTESDATGNNVQVARFTHTIFVTLLAGEEAPTPPPPTKWPCR